MINKIVKDVEREFNCPVNIGNCIIDIQNYYNPGRRQYDGNLLLQSISSTEIPDGSKAMGLFKIDLYIPILTYIFGQAMLNGNAGIASVYRLKNELYGLEKDQDLLSERFSKVVLHELGHAFGLIHCHHPACIMRSSTYVEDIDQKAGRFCIQCKEVIMTS
jgi:archaemetzincin